MRASFRLSALLAQRRVRAVRRRAVSGRRRRFAEPRAESPPPQPSSDTSKAGEEIHEEEAAKKEKTSEQQFIDGYRAAHATIYQRHDYAGGIAKLKALGRDDHPDVANLIGYSSRKLGRYDDAKLWYERALAADPRHARTWSYYGMWHAEQGNLLKARDHLAKVENSVRHRVPRIHRAQGRDRGHAGVLKAPTARFEIAMVAHSSLRPACGVAGFCQHADIRVAHASRWPRAALGRQLFDRPSVSFSSQARYVPSTLSSGITRIAGVS